MDADVIVIGAGLAGLQAARTLQEEGLTVTVLEGAGEVGGRVRTDRVDGFLVDRGFQILNPAYPAVRDFIDVPALRLQRFGVGVVVRNGRGLTTLAHPLRHPRLLPETLRSGYVTPGEVFALARWLAPTLIRETASSRATDDMTLAAALDAAGVTGPLRRNVLDTFLSGVLADASGTTSANFVRLLLRAFAFGAPGLPAQGMQALPEQMAAQLNRAPLTELRVTTVRDTGGGVEVETDAGVMGGRMAVVAAGPVEAAELTGMTAPAMNGLTTWWFSAPESPLGQKFLLLDASGPAGGPAGPVVHAAVVSEAAPSYAPAGRHLVEATTLLDSKGGGADEAAVRRDLERMYGTSVTVWELIARHEIPRTLPAQPPPLIDRRTQRVGDHVFVAGDHRDTASINGALTSGDRAARAVAGLLRGPNQA
ncbi:NAD(P)/FAD-dependent oxidoreductase [Corynebacterium comes]|uniref:Putrescine oxidase n=1 Tax=Corynebacterium comes TaxID=2675218 RepID=A0A6B8VFX6_9CORY|nr:NAD(P)/FAD-dependent oxidoreductase [Corynebacterium comes]QGU04182.1 Putrescine oxidase [Corynebacterium comes]